MTSLSSSSESLHVKKKVFSGNGSWLRSPLQVKVNELEEQQQQQSPYKLRHIWNNLSSRPLNGVKSYYSYYYRIIIRSYYHWLRERVLSLHLTARIIHILHSHAIRQKEVFINVATCKETCQSSFISCFHTQVVRKRFSWPSPLAISLAIRPVARDLSDMTFSATSSLSASILAF